MSRRARPFPGNLWLSLLAGLGGLVVWGCGPEPPPEPTMHRTSYSTLSRWRDPSLKERSAQHPKTAWLRTPAGRLPGFYYFDDFDLEVPLKEPIAGIVRGSYGFTTSPRLPRKSTRALFRILLRSPAGDREVLLHEAEFSSRYGLEFQDVEVPLPTDWEGAAFLRFEVRYLTRRWLRAAWLDPVVERLELGNSPMEGAPNLILITSDTTRQDTLGVYGGAATTPQLSALARDGILFRNAFSVAFGTTPSHSSLFTSSHPADHGVYDNATILGEGHKTLAEVLREAGYTTAAFVSATPVIRNLGLAQGFDHFDDIFLLDPESGLGRIARQQRRADLTISRCLRWLDEGPAEPFFIWLHLFDAHQPYSRPPGAESELVENPPTAFRSEDVEARFLSSNGNPRSVFLDEEFESEALRQAVARKAGDRYRGELAFLDQELKRLFERLRKTGLYGEAVIAFIADHGENLAEHERVLAFRHRGLHDGVTRIPLLLKLPGGRLGGTREEFLLGNLDLTPTLVDLLGLKAPEEWLGRSFLRSLGGEPESIFRPFLVLEGSHRQEISVRTSSFMYREVLPGHRERRDTVAGLGYDPERPVEFYDLRTDHEEQIDLASTAPKELEKLRALAREFLAEHARAEATALASEEHLQALEALGYVNN